MTREEVIKNAKKYWWFLRDNPEWNSDKEVVIAAIKQDGHALEFASKELREDKEFILLIIEQNGWALKYTSSELKNDKDIVLAAVQKNGYALEYASEELRKDKEIVLDAIREDIGACKYSLLPGYKRFNSIFKKEGEEFLFSCWNNCNENIRLQVAKHPNFLPTEKQIVIGLEDQDKDVRNIYELRKDEWLAKIEENKLRNIL